MNFKDDYQKINENITLDAAFTKQLAGQMERERKAMKNRKKVWISTGVAAAAAAVAAVVCIAILNGAEPAIRQPQMEDVGNKAETVDTAETSFAGHGLGQSAWYGDATTAKDMLKAFHTLLKEEEIKTLYCSEEEVFDEQDVLTEEGVATVIAALENAGPTEEQISGDCKYYMAVFENGTIVKFEIYGERYLKLKDSEEIYIL